VHTPVPLALALALPLPLPVPVVSTHLRIPLRTSAFQLILMLPHERLDAYWLAEYVAGIDYLLPRA